MFLNLMSPPGGEGCLKGQAGLGGLSLHTCTCAPGWLPLTHCPRAALTVPSLSLPPGRCKVILASVPCLPWLRLTVSLRKIRQQGRDV